MTIKEYVARGITLLDEKVPSWRDKINLDTLNLGSTDQCVLGQVFGYYNDGLAALGLLQIHAYRYGFAKDPRSIFPGHYYGSLTEEWKEALS